MATTNKRTGNRKSNTVKKTDVTNVDSKVTEEVVVNTEVVEETKPEKSSKKTELELVDTKEIKLNISKYLGIDLLPDVKKVVVENKGAGDVYVNNEPVTMKVDYLVTAFDSKEFDNVSQLFMVSACRPLVVIKQYK